ncbi:MAG: hypothetical protein M3O15_11000 [Acidobacteriota bacterium]|nr:hypothetical protein [Acidobacteriota bacterium]
MSEPREEMSAAPPAMPGGKPGGDRSRWMGGLFLLLACLYVVPIWSVHFIPTTDGPCHVYNAWILRQYGNTAQYPLFHEFYEINWQPVPNWTSHAVLALLMLAASPGIAEKVLLTGYMALFLGGLWYLAGAAAPERRWLAFLGVPLSYNLLLQLGFYNFSISLGCFMLAVGYFWRHRERPGLRHAVVLNLILLLCYFSHILSTDLALLSIAILWLSSFERQSWRRHLLHIPALAPQVVLPVWFLATARGPIVPSTLTAGQLTDFLLHGQVLHTFSRGQLRIGSALTALGLLLAVLTVLRENLSWDGRKPRLLLHPVDGFLLASCVCLVLYFLSPEGAAGGSVLKPRLSLYPLLLLLPWLSGRLGRAVAAAGVCVATVLALAYLGIVLHWYRALDPEVEAFVAGLDKAAPNSRLLPLLWKARGASPFVGIFGHAVDHVATARGLVDYDNYEATTALFPVRFKPSVHRPDLYTIEADPGALLIRQYRDAIDEVYCWHMPSDAPLEGRLGNNGFTLATDRGPARLYLAPSGTGRP